MVRRATGSASGDQASQKVVAAGDTAVQRLSPRSLPLVAGVQGDGRALRPSREGPLHQPLGPAPTCPLRAHTAVVLKGQLALSAAGWGEGAARVECRVAPRWLQPAALRAAQPDPTARLQPPERRGGHSCPGHRPHPSLLPRQAGCCLPCSAGVIHGSLPLQVPRRLLLRHQVKWQPPPRDAAVPTLSGTVVGQGSTSQGAAAASSGRKQ